MTTIARSDGTDGGVAPADCGCGGAGPREPVYAVGVLGFDFGTPARRELAAMINGGKPIFTNLDLKGALGKTLSPEEVIWTLLVDGVPVYAIRPSSPLSWSAFTKLLDSILTFRDPFDLVSVPGFLAGSVRLLGGQVVPVIDPDVYGIVRWDTASPVNAVRVWGGAALGPTGVDLSDPRYVDWISWDRTLGLAATRKSGSTGAIGDLRIVAPESDKGVAKAAAPPEGQVTGYTGSATSLRWTDGEGPATSPSTSGSAVSIVGKGLSFTVDAGEGPHRLQLYVRTFGCTAKLIAVLDDGGSDPAFVDTSFNAFPPIAGQPGVVDGVYTLTLFRRATFQEAVTGTPFVTRFRVQLLAVPAGVQSPNRSAVAAQVGTQSVPLGVGKWTASMLAASLPAGAPAITRFDIPAGLRVTTFEQDDFMGAGTAFAGPLVSPTLLFVVGAQSLIIEPESYVGVQGATLETLADVSPDLGALIARVRRVLANRGVTAEERAINAAVSHALNGGALNGVLGAGLSLETVEARPSPFQRTGSSLWDVELIFFSPLQVTQAPRTVVRLTVDVSHVRPIPVGPAKGGAIPWRTWTRY